MKNIFSSACEGTFSSCPPTVRSRRDPRSLREASAAQLLQSGWADWKFESHAWQGWKIPVVCLPLCQVCISTIPLWTLHDMPGGSKAVPVHTMIAHGVMGSRGINPLFLDLSMRWRWVLTSIPQPLLLPGVKDLGGCKPLVHAGNWNLGHSFYRLVTILTHLWEWLYPGCSISISDECAEGIWRCTCSIIHAETTRWTE